VRVAEDGGENESGALRRGSIRWARQFADGEVLQVPIPACQCARQAAEQAVEAVYRLSDDLEIPSLQALGFTEEEIPVLADMAFKDPQTIGNPRDLRRGSYVQIWQRAFDSGKK